jgi:hypothetical protein
MGVLYNTVKLSQDAQAQVMVSELLAMGIISSKEGKNIYDMNYYELRQELSVARFRGRDVGIREIGGIKR